jgi:hypothetical protein
VDLFGEHFVQVVTAFVEAAIVLLSAALVLLLSARRAGEGRLRPVPLRVMPQPLIGVLGASRSPAPPGDVGLDTCLPSRAPPPRPAARAARPSASPLPSQRPGRPLPGVRPRQ